MPPLSLASYFRIVIIYSSAALSLIFMMLTLNIITIPEIITILKLNPNSPQAKVLSQVLSRMQEVTENILRVIAQLFSKILSSFGMDDIDISKIKIRPDDKIIIKPPHPPIPDSQPIITDPIIIRNNETAD